MEKLKPTRNMSNRQRDKLLRQLARENDKHIFDDVPFIFDARLRKPRKPCKNY